MGTGASVQSLVVVVICLLEMIRTIKPRPHPLGGRIGRLDGHNMLQGPVLVYLGGSPVLWSKTSNVLMTATLTVSTIKNIILR